MAGEDIRLAPETLRSIDSATFTGSYQALGTPLVHAARIVKFTNNSNKDVTVSWDGVNDNEFIPMGSFMLMDVGSDRELTSELYIPAKTQFYVKGSPGAGLFYLSSYYA